ncbi:phenylacetate--CoA ligase family protein [Flavivirga spongiicola]|uniref:Phenylacetate--CoA ligase family protein n=1 Tax=Flavivirga spongiicola TaxID=421621 RepID=A0ABU7XST0_9FLAO|nr:phenylacetate--CoA ligase family protein [Flavivirga sp. MEBiC05379]MDO5978832.1 phenylacetate--CoA ligase family protein [Flavivirga sp. MEBiC05379]
MLRIHEYFLFTLHKLSFLLNLFELSLKLKGFSIRKAKLALKAIQKKSDSEFNTYIKTKKKDIVNYHLKHNSFYKSFAKDANPLDWNTVPIMSKKDLQQPLVTLLSNRFSTKNIYIDKTSGASGHPFIFSKDKFTHALTWSIIMDRFSWFNLNFNSTKQARFYGIPLDRKGYYTEKLKDFISNRYRFNVFDLSDEALENWLIDFKRKPFFYMNGYTSPIVQFAKYLRHKNIILKAICPTLKACVVTSEMLFKDDKQLMEKQFGIPVINEYGASELDLIAFENTNGEWIVNSETLFVEVLDENNNVLPNGEEGRLVITSLYNKTQPFIRYDIGDIGVLSQKSTPKKPILEKLIGRTNDMASLPSGKKAAGLTFYYITKSIIEDDGNVKEFVIVQLKLDTFKIYYVSDIDISQNKMTMIKNEMENYLENGLTILFERQTALKRLKSGKLKQFSSLIYPNK